MKAILTLLILSLTVVASQAQPAPATRIVSAETPLQMAIDQQLQIYAEGGRPEVLRTSNALIYPFGVYQPVLSCTVLRICVIELEPGEELYSMGAGDHVRWHIDHGTTGPSGNTIYLTIVPTDFNLTTNLVISTNKRMYHLTLDSPPKREGVNNLNPLEAYTRHIRFYYPKQMHVVQSAEPQPDPPFTQTVDANLDDLDYGYSWRTENGFPWEPLAVFDDGKRVFLRVPPEATGGAVLLLGQKTDARAGNYLVRDDFFIIERMFDEARIVMPGPQKRRFFWQKRKQAQRALIITKS